MKKTYALVLVLFVVAFAAGLTSGLAGQKMARQPHHHHGGWLANKLHLTADQQKQMLQIWSGVVKDGRHKQMQQRHQLEQQRDQAIQQLLTPTQRKQYTSVIEKYHQNLADLAAKRHAQFKQAVDKTRAMLTPEQRKLYDQLLASPRKSRGGSSAAAHGGPGEHGFHGRHDWQRHAPPQTQP